MSTVSLQVDPTSLLAAPHAGGTDPMIKLRQQSGVAGVLDNIVRSLTGFSPLEEWVFKPFAGDWTALLKGGDAWNNAGRAANELAGLMDSLPAQVGDDWTGATATAWAGANKTVADEFRQLPQLCAAMSQACSALSDAAQSIATFVADLLAEISDWLTAMAVEAAVPIAGWIADAASAAWLSAKVTLDSTKIGRAIVQFMELVERVLPTLARIKALLQKLQALVAKLKPAMAAFLAVPMFEDVTRSAADMGKASRAVGATVPAGATP